MRKSGVGTGRSVKGVIEMSSSQAETSSPREAHDLVSGPGERAESQELIQRLRLEIAELERANLALKGVQRRLHTEREEERKALSRELHDGVIQDLVSIKYEVELIAGDAERLMNGLSEVQDALRDVIDRVRHVCTGLRPPTMDSLGLNVAIQSFAYDWSARAGLAVQLDLDNRLGRLPEALELSIFRVVQEALNNVRRHAQASTAYVSLRRASPEALLLSVADDGRGMHVTTDLEALAAAGHYGLLGISERVALIGGRMEVQNQPGGGVLLQIEVPHPQASE